MFKRRDIPPVLLLLLLIILVMLTLSQILVVHNGRYGRNVHSMRKLQLELREMDVNLHALMMQNVPSIELNRRLLQNQINAQRFAEILSKASRKDPDDEELPDLPSSRLGRTGRGAKSVSVAAPESGAIWRREFDHGDGSPNSLTSADVQSSGKNNSGSGPVLRGHHHPGRSLSISDSFRTNEISVAVTSPDRHSARSAQSPSTEIGVGEAGSIFDRGSSTGHRDGIQIRHKVATALLQESQVMINSASLAPRQGTLIRGVSVQSEDLSNSVQPAQSSDILINASGVKSHRTGINESSVRPEWAQNDGEPIQSQGVGSSRQSQRTLSNGSPVQSQRTLSDGSPVQSQQGLDIMRDRGHKTKISYCPSVPPLLRGNIGVNLGNSSRLTWDNVAVANPEIQPGGAWSPRRCVARHRVAIIIPYRDREQHLITLLYYLHPVLQRQQLDYRIYVVEQYGRDTFNKARIMNIAFVEALKQYHFQCFVFHDVDLVPEDDRNMYSCPQQPRHMSVAIDEMGYKLAYQELVGGVLNMRTEHFQRVNGYSNLYWGWGAEDDDMAYRIMHVGLKITRPPETTARYKMAKHTKRKPSDWRKRAKLLYTGTRRFQFDGLNSLQYKVAHIKEMPLYTHLLVDIGRPPRGF